MPSVAERQPQKHANIFLAASDGDIDSVLQFLDAGVGVNALDENGYSTIHAAASYNHFELLSTLISRGGNVNLPDYEGDTPIYVAETAEMCRLLISQGADLAHVNGEGLTVLEHVTQEDEFPEVIAFLNQQVHGGSVASNLSNMRYEEQTPIGGETEVSQADESLLSGMDEIPEEIRTQIGDIMRKTGEDGINRDDELRAILSNALLGRGFSDGDAGRQRTQ